MVRSLYEMAKSQLIRNIDELDDIGEVPYSFLRPVLIKMNNPGQLRQLEQRCPQILGETGEIWLKLIKRDFLDWDKKPHEPKNPKLWWKVYRKMAKDAENQRLAAEKMLKERMASYQKEKEANRTTVTREYIQMPKKKPRPVGRRDNGPDPALLRFTGGSKTKDPILKFKRQVAEQKLQRQGALTTPTHLLASRASRVTAAPRSLVEAKKAELSRPTKVFAPKSSISKSTSPGTKSSANPLADREARLRAIQSGRSPASPPSPSSAIASPSKAPSAAVERTHLTPGMTYKVPRKAAPPRPEAPSPRTPELKRKREVSVLKSSKRTKA